MTRRWTTSRSGTASQEQPEAVPYPKRRADRKDDPLAAANRETRKSTIKLNLLSSQGTQLRNDVIDRSKQASTRKGVSSKDDPSVDHLTVVDGKSGTARGSALPGEACRPKSRPACGRQQRDSKEHHKLQPERAETVSIEENKLRICKRSSVLRQVSTYLV